MTIDAWADIEHLRVELNSLHMNGLRYGVLS